jgi:hypothetical protein
MNKDGFIVFERLTQVLPIVIVIELTSFGKAVEASWQVAWDDN